MAEIYGGYNWMDARKYGSLGERVDARIKELETNLKDVKEQRDNAEARLTAAIEARQRTGSMMRKMVESRGEAVVAQRKAEHEARALKTELDAVNTRRQALEKALRDALGAFKCTQDPDHYEAHHWSHRAEKLLKPASVLEELPWTSVNPCEAKSWHSKNVDAHAKTKVSTRMSVRSIEAVTSSLRGHATVNGDAELLFFATDDGWSCSITPRNSRDKSWSRSVKYARGTEHLMARDEARVHMWLCAKDYSRKQAGNQ